MIYAYSKFNRTDCNWPIQLFPHPGKSILMSNMPIIPHCNAGNWAIYLLKIKSLGRANARFEISDQKWHKVKAILRLRTQEKIVAGIKSFNWAIYIHKCLCFNSQDMKTKMFSLLWVQTIFGGSYRQNLTNGGA